MQRSDNHRLRYFRDQCVYLLRFVFEIPKHFDVVLCSSMYYPTTYCALYEPVVSSLSPVVRFSFSSVRSLAVAFP